MTTICMVMPDAARLELIDQEAVQHAQQGARQNGDGDHEAKLSRLQMKAVPDLHAQRPEQHPDHERHVEIEKGAEQGRQMADIAKSSLHGVEAPGGYRLRTVIGPRTQSELGFPYPDRTRLLLCTRAQGRLQAPPNKHSRKSYATTSSQAPSPDIQTYD